MDTTASPTGVRPLSVNDINNHMDIFVSSSSKAYADGFQASDSQQLSGSADTIAVNAHGQDPRVMLITSKPLLIATIALTVVIMILIAVLVAKPPQGSPLSLQSVLGALQSARSPALGGTSSSTIRLPANYHQHHTRLAGSDIPLLDLHSRESNGSDNDIAHSPQRRRYIAFASFLVLELAYIAFSAVSLRGIPLPELLVAHQTEAKGGFTVVFIVWQSLATFPAANIVYHAFCDEWFYQLEHTREIIPGVTDSVSTLTATVVDRANHFRARAASTAFKIAFIASLILLALSSLAPGVIHVVLASIPQSGFLPIGNMTIISMEADGIYGAVMSFAIQRAWLITLLEQVEQSRFGYSMQPNTIVGWPSLDLMNTSGLYQYHTDVVRYNFSCEWVSPTMNRSISANGLDWELGSLSVTPSLSSNPNAGKLVSSCTN